MTFDELRELVDSTISENGSRSITGKALNLALLGIITAMEENKPEGGGALYVRISDDSDETLALNAATYAKAKEAFLAGQPLPVIALDQHAQYTSLLGAPIGAIMLASETLYIEPGSAAASMVSISGLLALFVTSSSKNIVAFAEDGTYNLVK